MGDYISKLMISNPSILIISQAFYIKHDATQAVITDMKRFCYIQLMLEIWLVLFWCMKLVLKPEWLFFPFAQTVSLQFFLRLELPTITKHHRTFQWQLVLSFCALSTAHLVINGKVLPGSGLLSADVLVKVERAVFPSKDTWSEPGVPAGGEMKVTNETGSEMTMTPAGDDCLCLYTKYFDYLLKLLESTVNWWGKCQVFPFHFWIYCKPASTQWLYMATGLSTCDVTHRKRITSGSNQMKPIQWTYVCYPHVLIYLQVRS